MSINNAHFFAALDNILTPDLRTHNKSPKTLNTRTYAENPLMAKMMKRLRLVTDTENKFCNMTEKDDGWFDVEYGNIGTTRPKHAEYQMSAWRQLYYNMINNGYEDVSKFYRSYKDDNFTNLRSLGSLNSSPFDDIIKKLQKHLKPRFQKNSYEDLVPSNSTTIMMLTEAQQILDNLATKGIQTEDPQSIIEYVAEFNDELIKLFKILPRKMPNVRDFMIDLSKATADKNGAINNQREFLDNRAKEIIQHEQSILDKLIKKFKKENPELDPKKHAVPATLLQQLGIEMKKKDSDLEKIIKNMLGEIVNYYSDCWYVTNNSTQSNYDAHISSLKGIHTKEEIFWHGSKNENWLSIISKGLVIRGDNAKRTGAMFGDGIYFADLAKKGFGYTSAKGSYWAHGNSNIAYMALFKVNVGKQLEISQHTDECFDYNADVLKAKGDYDSVYAKAGQSLKNDEFIIYDPAQCTIFALVELRV